MLEIIIIIIIVGGGSISSSSSSSSYVAVGSSADPLFLSVMHSIGPALDQWLLYLCYDLLVTCLRLNIINLFHFTFKRHFVL